MRVIVRGLTPGARAKAGPPPPQKRWRSWDGERGDIQRAHYGPVTATRSTAPASSAVGLYLRRAVEAGAAGVEAEAEALV